VQSADLIFAPVVALSVIATSQEVIKIVGQMPVKWQLTYDSGVKDTEYPCAVFVVYQVRT
jgi:hypothetical protein